VLLSFFLLVDALIMMSSFAIAARKAVVTAAAVPSKVKTVNLVLSGTTVPPLFANQTTSICGGLTVLHDNIHHFAIIGAEKSDERHSHGLRITARHIGVGCFKADFVEVEGQHIGG